MPQGKHPFPFRTRKLRPAGLMVLEAQASGRVRRCQGLFFIFRVFSKRQFCQSRCFSIFYQTVFLHSHLIILSYSLFFITIVECSHENCLGQITMSIEREKQTICFMVKIYCRGKHKEHDDLCPECEQLLGYANKKLSKCPFGDSKTSCKKCKVHCYEKEMREKVHKVMKYSGSRMLLRHPVLAILHLFR